MRYITPPRGGDFGQQAEERYSTTRKGLITTREEDIPHTEEKTYSTKILMTPIVGAIDI